MKYYPKCKVVIDCTGVVIETPTSLNFAAVCWSQYKHHYTVKFMVGVTPNSVVSFISDCHGGRTSDVFIVEDCGIAKKLLPNDQVMADRGFKIRDLLAYYQCSLCIPPSKHADFQMSKEDVAQASRIPNVRICVEKAFRGVKEYRILKSQHPVLFWPPIDEIVTACAAMTNLRVPLLEL